MSQSTRTEAWIDEARSLDSDEFLARYPGYFLLATEEPEGSPNVDETWVAQSLPAAVDARRVPRFEVRWIGSPRGPEVITVGRSPNCDIMFRNHEVSKVHARFCPQEEGLTITDLGSRNGTRVNGQALESGRPTPVYAHDHIQFGSVKTRLIAAREMQVLLSRLA
jgi:hypothetical protein